MPARLIDGRAHARAIREGLRAAVAESLHQPNARPPGLAVIQVGHDPASSVYVNGKRKAALDAGFNAVLERIQSATQSQLESRIEAFGSDPDIDGILLQLPLPSGLDPDSALLRIPAYKDVDGLHPYNAGLLAQGRPAFVPATPLGVLELLKREGVEIRGRRAVVIGRSRLVGRPLSHLLLMQDATVTICHSRTIALPQTSRQADILVAAAGRPGLITAEHVRPGAVVIDVGISPDPNSGKLRGDVDLETVEPVASLLTPVPGGVGPMTIAMVLSNTLDAYRRHRAGRSQQ